MGCGSVVHHKVNSFEDAHFHDVLPCRAGNGSPVNNVHVEPHQAAANFADDFETMKNLQHVTQLPNRMPKERANASFHDQFVIVGKLGKGSFARVYSTICKVEGTSFAAKVTDLRAPVHQRGQSPKARGGLCPKMQMLCASEVQILREIGHQKHCIHLLDSYQEGFLSYIVMEQCEMTLLQGIECSGDVNETLYAKVFRDMLSALASIHALQIMHLDVKPDNFLCQGTARTGVIKLCDFGLAKRTTLGSARKGNKDLHGTAPYMAPEMLLQAGYDEKSDVWSFAVIVYVLFFGCFPYQPTERGVTAMKVAIANGYPAPDFLPRSHLKSSQQPHVSFAAEEFCRQVLNRDPMFRVSSRKALRHTFLSAARAEEQPSLSPLLDAAKGIGAFTKPISRKEREISDSVDETLYELQARSSPCGSSDAVLKLMGLMHFGSATTAASSGTLHSSSMGQDSRQGAPSGSSASMAAGSFAVELEKAMQLQNVMQLRNRVPKARYTQSADDLPVIAEQPSIFSRTADELPVISAPVTSEQRRTSRRVLNQPLRRSTASAASTSAMGHLA